MAVKSLCGVTGRKWAGGVFTSLLDIPQPRPLPFHPVFLPAVSTQQHRVTRPLCLYAADSRLPVNVSAAGMAPRLPVLMCLVVQLCLGDQPVEEVITSSKFEDTFQNVWLIYCIKY